jgi:hypothetical protein
MQMDHLGADNILIRCEYGRNDNIFHGCYGSWLLGHGCYDNIFHGCYSTFFHSHSDNVHDMANFCCCLGNVLHHYCYSNEPVLS